MLDDVRTNVVNAARTYRKYAFFGQTLLFVALLGLIAAPWRRRRLASEAYLLAMMLPLGFFTLFFIKDRFLYATLLPLTLWSAQGIRHVLEWIRRTEIPAFRGLGALRRAGEVTAVLLVLVYLANTNRHVFAQREAVRQPDQWATSAAIREHTAPGAKVITTMPNLTFHADREWLPMPVAPLPDVVDYGRRRGAEFLVMNKWRSELRPSEQRALLESPRTYPGLELVHVEPDVCAVYRLVDSDPLAKSAANGVAEISEPDDDHRSDTGVEDLELQRP